MKPRISVITIGVDDLEASLKFYRDGLGLPTEGIIGKEFEHGAVAFFDLQDGVKLALFPRADIARDAGIKKTERSPTEFTLGHNVVSEDEVDAVMEHAVAAGARQVKPAQKTFWGGYAGYFQDPDGHLWEVVYNPAFSAQGLSDHSFIRESSGMAAIGASGPRSEANLCPLGSTSEDCCGRRP